MTLVALVASMWTGLGPTPPDLPPSDPPGEVSTRAPLVMPDEVEVALPEEFADIHPALLDGSKSSSSEPIGSRIDVGDEPPPLRSQTEALHEPDYGGADGPVAPFENLVTVRTAAARTPPPTLTFKGSKPAPERTAFLGAFYRHFALADQLQRHQDWHVVGLELHPVRRYVRLGLATELGIEGGEAAQHGDRADIMILQKLGLGVQYPYWVSPYAEFQAGVGGMRVELFERNDLALMYSLGVDGGIQIAAAKHFFMTAAVGWLRPYLRVGGRTRYYDRLTFKVGVGF